MKVFESFSVRARKQDFTIIMAPQKRMSLLVMNSLQTRRIGPLLLRLAVRFGTRGFMYWMVDCRLFLRVFVGSFTFRGVALRGAIWAGSV